MVKKIFLVLFLVIGVIFSAGCGNGEDVDLLRKRVAVLEERLSEIENEKAEEEVLTSAIVNEIVEGKLSSFRDEIVAERLLALEIAVSELRQNATSQPIIIYPSAPSACSFSFKAKVYKGENFNEYIGSLPDPYPIDFNWGSSGPLSLKDGFSVRWEGSITLDSSGTWIFSIQSDDGVRLWIDGGLKVNKWVPQDSKTHELELVLAKGCHDIVLEYFERTGKANICFDWFKK